MKVLIAFLFFFFWGSLSSANSQQLNRGIMNQNCIIQYSDQLNLSDEQKRDIIALQFERREQFRGTRGSLRGQQRGAGWSGYCFYGPSSAIPDMLTESQAAQLQTIRAKRAESQHEFRTIRNEVFVEQVYPGDNPDAILSRLNQISSIQQTMHLYRIENPGEYNAEIIRENMAEIRTIQDNLKSMVTAAEYEQLRPVMMMGPQMQRAERPARRAMMRRR